MSNPRLFRSIAIPAIAIALAAIAFGASEYPKSSASGIMGVSKPSTDVILSFGRPGLVQNMYFKEGEQVKAHQLVAKQDDREEQAALAIDADKADDTTSIGAEKAVLEQKQKDVDKMVARKGAVGDFEVDAAKLEVTVAKARILLAERQHKQDGLKLIQTQIAVKKLELQTPIDGVVARTFLNEGEVADGGNMKAMEIIQVDPMWVEVPVPIADANRLKKDDTATVIFLDKTRTGKVFLISPLDDSGSQRRVVKLEVPNPEHYQPGEVVTVNFATLALTRK